MKTPKNRSESFWLKQIKSENMSFRKGVALRGPYITQTLYISNNFYYLCKKNYYEDEV